jgi:hypothetical protein
MAELQSNISTPLPILILKSYFGEEPNNELLLDF